MQTRIERKPVFGRHCGVVGRRGEQVHAAAEIKRVLKSVLEDRMPRDEAGIEQPLNGRAKAALLAEGAPPSTGH